MDGKNVNAGENRVWWKSEKLFVWYDGEVEGRGGGGGG